MIILFVISLLVNGFFLVYIIGMRRGMKRSTEHLSQVTDGNSRMSLPLSGSATFDEFIGEVNRLMEQINQQTIEFEQAIDENKRMVSSISHDFRTPLTSMLGYVQLMKQKNQDPENQKYLSIIEERTQLLGNLVEDFYTLSLLNSEESGQDSEWLNPIILVQEQLATYYEELETHFNYLDIQLDTHAIWTELSKNDFQRLMSNLIKNAIQHGTESFKVFLMMLNDQAIFYFENKVTHPEKIEVDNLFERMYQADESRSNHSSGLGLAIALKIAEQAGMALSARLNGNTLSFVLEMTIVKEK